MAVAHVTPGTDDYGTETSRVVFTDYVNNHTDLRYRSTALPLIHSVFRRVMPVSLLSLLSGSPVPVTFDVATPGPSGMSTS